MLKSVPFIYGRCLALGLVIASLAGCVYDPYPPPPPPGPVVAAPGYYGGPCCYAYPEYPVYGPSVGISFGRGGWGGGGGHWR